MKKIDIANNFTESVLCLQDGRMVIRMRTPEYYESLLTKINQFARTLEDGIEKIDESQPDVSCRFGFVGDKSTRSITFNGDLKQVLGFCITYKLLTASDRATIFDALNPPKKEGRRNNFFQWLLKARNNNSPEDDGNKSSFKKE